MKGSLNVRVIIPCLVSVLTACTQSLVKPNQPTELAQPTLSPLAASVPDIIVNDDGEIADLQSIVSMPTRTPSADLVESLSKDYVSGGTFVSIREPRWLEEIEGKGYAFPQVFGSKPGLSNADLVKQNALYLSLVQTIEGDLDDLMKRENSAKPQQPAGVGMRFARRIFDAGWLRSPFARFELIGVINRIDRVAFNAHSCGELRFIYRLAYQTKKIYSRMPMTLLVKYMYNGDASQNWTQCKQIADRWKFPTGLMTDAEVSNWILSAQGPVNGTDFKPGGFHTLELNLQAMRIPSKARPQLAGEGTYLQRVFKMDGSVLVPDYLENTPDVDRLKSDPSLRKSFLDQFKNRHFIDRLSNGILILDEKYLTKRYFGYSPYGISRLSNRPFDQFISVADLSAYEFKESKYVTTPSAALIRLNDLSCVGCHQGRAHAGFHFLGIDKASTHPFNALFFEGSGHFEIELKRRMKYIKNMQANFLPNPTRPMSLAPPEGELAGRGHFCGLPGSAFQDWKCADGLSCQHLDEAQGFNELGKCLPQTLIGGDPFLEGTLTQTDHENDEMVMTKTNTCGDEAGPLVQYGTYVPDGGFPSGVCFRRSCKGLQPNVGEEVCAQAAGNGFNACIASTAKARVSFEQCLEKTVNYLGFGRCTQSMACRNDYVCARNKLGEGFCTPPYFLFQIRLDGHPNPMTGT